MSDPEAMAKPSLQAALRAARRELAQMADEAEVALFAANGTGHLGTDSHPRNVARICAMGFERAVTVAARTFAGLKGRAAQGRSDAFRGAIEPLSGETLDIFDSNDGTGTRYRKPVEVRAELQARLAQIAEDVAADLSAGVFHMANPPRPGVATSIVFNGSATNVAIAADGSFVRVEGGQSAPMGISQAEVLEALEQIEAAIAASALSHPEKEAAGDAIINARREVTDPAPDAGRLKRYLAIAGDLAGKVGTSAAGGVIAKTLGLWAGLGA